MRWDFDLEDRTHEVGKFSGFQAGFPGIQEFGACARGVTGGVAATSNGAALRLICLLYWSLFKTQFQKH